VSEPARRTTPAPPPAPTSPSPPPPAPPPTPVTLFGTIFELAPDGTRRPLAARQVSIEVEVPTATDPRRGGWVPVGADGRYRLSGVPDGHFVKIEGVDLTGIRDQNRYRKCATNTIIRGDTQLDVELLLPGTPAPGPTLSGQVYTMDGASRVPLARATMYYRSRGFGPDTWAVTDEAGRYSLAASHRCPQCSTWSAAMARWHSRGPSTSGQIRSWMSTPRRGTRAWVPGDDGRRQKPRRRCGARFARRRRS
jgi:hypothetical protein